MTRRSLARQLATLGAALTALALALAGCGLVTASAPTTVQLVVTRDFGARVLYRSDGLRASAGETMLGLLRSRLPVSVSSGGLVEGVDGIWGGPQAGTPAGSARWLYYVNGVQITSSPASTSVRPGDHIWWDLHEARQGADAAAVVGSFPEPFLNGVEGKRLPVRIECTSSSEACQTVTASLRRLSVPAAVAALGSGAAPETLRVLVGPWARIEGELAPRAMASGPSVSGVDARFSASGQTLTLLDQQGAPVQQLGAGAGLVAATRGAREAPVWIVTGTDGAGVQLAARAFDRATLEHRFAVALRPGAVIALPAR